ncbi:MAG TPA: hypothetical protein ENI20_08435 [Bacteroides sp.]|nr:hypothetical protein [Bacteroides sp.]
MEAAILNPDCYSNMPLIPIISFENQWKKISTVEKVMKIITNKKSIASAKNLDKALGHCIDAIYGMGIKHTAQLKKSLKFFYEAKVSIDEFVDYLSGYIMDDELSSELFELLKSHQSKLEYIIDYIELVLLTADAIKKTKKQKKYYTSQELIAELVA